MRFPHCLILAHCEFEFDTPGVEGKGYFYSINVSLDLCDVI